MAILTKQLKLELPQGHAEKRKHFAKLICEQQIDLNDLLPLAFENETVASRFFWLLSDVGEIDARKLVVFLPKLFSIRKETTYQNIPHSFSRYWNLYGIPQENEAEAIENLFAWLVDSSSEVSVKVHAMRALFKLTKKHDGIRNELAATINRELGKSTQQFDKVASSILKEL
ncbi:MAG: hypothetical protein KDC92_10235 [Bacteroidetes bacterium]|nr:hypothetical protein [Bacteroidota bacterium]